MKSTSNGGAATFSYGYNPLFPKWVIYAAAAAGGTILILCLVLCFWFIRRQARKRAEEENKVKKYSTDHKKNTSSDDRDKLSRFKYGRQSRPINTPHFAENQDEMIKPDPGDFHDINYDQQHYGSPDGMYKDDFYGDKYGKDGV